MQMTNDESAQMKKPFAPWCWIPFQAGTAGLAILVVAAALDAQGGWVWCGWAGAAVSLLSLLYFLVQAIARFSEKRWKSGGFALLRLAGLGVLAISAVVLTFLLSLESSLTGPSEDHFADHLTIPNNLDVAIPADETFTVETGATQAGSDAMQLAVHAALDAPGGTDPSIFPAMPSLRKASTAHHADFLAYIEASPDWHVFYEGGNRFAARCWSYNGEPRDTLHGYISESGGGTSFQTRTLLCLDQKPWSSYQVQHCPEGSSKVALAMTKGNQLDESRIMIECGGVWVEVFEESPTLERRVTKASIAVLEQEFAEFVKDPAAALSREKDRSRQLALRRATATHEPFFLTNGMQPGIYEITYAMNPGEAGVVYLQAFEVTQGTPLSTDRLKGASETRMTWSSDPAEKFGAKAGFTIYEGDWGKPYAARFEVWFQPDHKGSKERKLAERIYKIEGWQR